MEENELQVATPVRNNKGNGWILKPADFHDIVSSNKKFDTYIGIGKVIFPPQGVALEEGALYLVSGEDKGRYIVGKGIKILQVSHGYGEADVSLISPYEEEIEKGDISNYNEWYKSHNPEIIKKKIVNISYKKKSEDFKREANKIIADYNLQLQEEEIPTIRRATRLEWVRPLGEDGKVKEYRKSHIEKACDISYMLLSEISEAPNQYKFGTEIFADSEPFNSHDNDVVSVHVIWEGLEIGQKSPIELSRMYNSELILSLYGRAENIISSDNTTVTHDVLKFVLVYSSELPEDIKNEIKESIKDMNLRDILSKYIEQIYGGLNFIDLNRRGVKSLMYALIQHEVLIKKPEEYKNNRFYSKRYIYNNSPEKHKEIILRETEKERWNKKDVEEILNDFGIKVENKKQKYFIIFEPISEIDIYEFKGYGMFDEEGYMEEDSYGYTLPWRDEVIGTGRYT